MFIIEEKTGTYLEVNHRSFEFCSLHWVYFEFRGDVEGRNTNCVLRLKLMNKYTRSNVRGSTIPGTDEVEKKITVYFIFVNRITGQTQRSRGVKSGFLVF